MEDKRTPARDDLVDCLNFDPHDILKNLRNKNTNMIIFGHLNINHIVNKFESLVYLIKGRVDIMLCSEIKTDSSFPQGQFRIEGYSPPFRKDRDRNGGGLLLYVREDIPSKEVMVKLPIDVECLFIEVRIQSKK